MNSRHWRADRDGVKCPPMYRGKGPARGLEEISSLFLSSTEPDRSAETIPHPTPSPSGSPLLFPVFCCVSPSPAVESFFACNFAVEIAKNDQTVTIIDFCFERSIVRHLMGFPHPTQGAIPSGNTVHSDYRVESIRFRGMPEITLISPALPGEQDLPKSTVERIFAQEQVRKANLILINCPVGPDRIGALDIFTRFHSAILLIDDQVQSLVKAYSWIKRLSSRCNCCLIGAVFGEGEDSNTVLQNVSKLQKTIFKHLPLALELRVVTIPLDREARISMQSRKPLALLEPPTSCSAKAIAKLCENLLRN
jgi:MinD-like ATPase involved in chromosome partitioning or flagellar assembly